MYVATASYDQIDKAIDAVRMGLASQAQKKMVEAAAKQAGSRGNRARAAIQDKR